MKKRTAQSVIVFGVVSLSLVVLMLLSTPSTTNGAAPLQAATPTLTAEICLNNTGSEAECKDCCDSLDADGTARKTCRDECPKHDFSQNTNLITIQTQSVLGPNGDYALCTVSGDERTCKACCDGSSDILSGDRRFCRDACAALSGGNTPPPQPGGGDNPAPSQQDGGNPSSPRPGGDNPPPQQPGGNPPPPQGSENNPPSADSQAPREMTIEQAISNEAQRNTIAFDGLAFLTGSLGADSFFPPGKVADFWGFQYLRDNDPSQMGHNTDFLTRASLNMLYVLTPDQRAELIALAAGQVDSINEYAYRRFVLMEAFRRLLEGNLPAGSTGLDQNAVMAYSADLYRLDGEISYERAQVMGMLLNSLTSDQRAYLDAMVGKGMLEWPNVEEPEDVRGLDRDVKIAVMTYAGDMYSWYAGSVEADVYFCPERQGTYFGSFYLKDAPAMGNPDYTISSSLTGDMGRAFLDSLTPDQSALVTGLVDIQRPYLLEIVDTRREVATLLRGFMTGETPDHDTVLNLMARYGELDGAIVYQFATNFALVNQSLTSEQAAQLMAFRTEMLGDMVTPVGAYLYSQPIDMPEIPDTDFLFTVGG